jgi:hypothetical protein
MTLPFPEEQINKRDIFRFNCKGGHESQSAPGSWYAAQGAPQATRPQEEEQGQLPAQICQQERR